MSTQKQYRSNSKVKWFKTDVSYLQTDLKIDAENGIINGVSLCSVGEAKGHGVLLDQSFIDNIVALGSQLPQGLKCRFGHPSMSNEALGTYLGRFKNFRTEGEKAVADLYLDPVAKQSPNGDLFSYVVKMAATNPDMFGASIVFTPGECYQISPDGEKVPPEGYDSLFGFPIKKFEDEPWYASIEELHGADVVDEPAANEDGLFSASAKFNADKFAVRVSEFLDSNPDIWDFIDKHPEKFEAFLERYNQYKQRKSKSSMSHKANPKKQNFFQKLAAAMLSQADNHQQFGTIDAATAEGTNIRIVCQGDAPAPGDDVYVVAADGTEEVAPDGQHTIVDGDYDGYIITVASGKITTVVDPAQTSDQPGDQPGANPPSTQTQQSAVPSYKKLQSEVGELKKKLSNAESANKQLQTQYDALKKEFEEFKAKPRAEHTEVVITEKTDKELGDEVFYNQPWNAKAKKP